MDHPGLLAERNYNDFQNITPKQYGEFYVYNASGADIPGNSFVEITGVCTAAGAAGRECYKVEKPSGDSLAAVLVCHLGIPTGKAGVATLDYRNSGLAVKYDGDTPAIGDTVGTQTGSFLAKKGNTGFTVLKVNTDKNLVFCAQTGGGGSASLEIVQAMGDGSAGVVQTQTMTFKANVAASPNFDLSGSNVAANYFKL